MAFLKALYFAALLPSQEVKEVVRNLKLEIKEKFGAAHALKLPAHITLIAPVWLQNEQEKPLVEAIREVSKEQVSFPVELEGFGKFDQQAIFLNVVDHEPVKVLHHKLAGALTGIFTVREERNLHPHITLATRDLPQNRFKEAWESFNDRDILLGFDATALTLFKHNGKTWDVLENLPFLKSPQ